ncbi:hypothetical protein F2Y93_02985, partial (plasmid) [Aphanizomenon flos-aquae CCAP 1446/1C]|nr:hypothetical protein [Anabaena sp. CCAP 1446/1C]
IKETQEPDNEHSYSSPILKVGVSAALAQVGWNIDAFLRRGGIYSWK